MIYLLLSLVGLLIIINIWLTVKKAQPHTNDDYNIRFDALEKEVKDVEKEVLRLETSMKDEFSRNREETQKSFKENRTELSQSLATFSELLTNTVKGLSGNQKEQFDTFSGLVKEFSNVQVQKFNELIKKQEQLKQETESKLELIRDAVEKKLDVIQQNNEKKLEQMRATVDEKLQTTLEKRLSESFKLVSERLEQVHKGLGEMQSLASEVGDLKKVFSNVKTKGVIGEIQLGAILESMLSPGQFEKNVKTKKGSADLVEYAIVLPGKDEQGQPVYLPIDAKFPTEDYVRLVDAYENANAADIKTSSANLNAVLKKCAKDIHDKYIDPPNTTDFGILFLPVEGLYAEVVRQPGLIEELSRNFKIIIAGPTTLAAILNSLQLGFRTLAIEKRSSEVWKVLQAIKTEFGNFEKVLTSAKQKIDRAGEDIDKLIGVRTRKIQVKLNHITELPEEEAKNILDTNNVDMVNDEDDNE